MTLPSPRTHDGDRRSGSDTPLARPVRCRSSRAQLVLVAAVLLAVALVPMVLAYLQLGYDADVRASGDRSDPARRAEGVLSRAVHDAAVANGTDVDGTIERTRTRLAPWLERLRSSRVESGVAYDVSYNESAAREWATRACPDGEGQSFGPCRTREGIVVQERSGAVHAVAVAFDVVVVTRSGETRLTWVVRPVGGTASR